MHTQLHIYLYIPTYVLMSERYILILQFGVRVQSTFHTLIHTYLYWNIHMSISIVAIEATKLRLTLVFNWCFFIWYLFSVLMAYWQSLQCSNCHTTSSL